MQDHTHRGQQQSTPYLWHVVIIEMGNSTHHIATCSCLHMYVKKHGMVHLYVGKCISKYCCMYRQGCEVYACI